MPECSIIIYDSTKEELLQDLKAFSIPEEFAENIITRESFNDLIAKEAHDVIMHVMNAEETSCDSIKLTSDSVICNSEERIVLFAIHDINRVEVFYGNRTLNLLRNSALLGAMTSSLAALGYLPPNPPQPEWKSFAGLWGFGFVMGIVFNFDSSKYYCLVSKEAYISSLKENKDKPSPCEHS
jgi:hypothetical protein